MPVFTFSTPAKRPQDEITVKAVKQHCEKHHLNFSGIIVELLEDYRREKDITNDV
jgi:hypothetical protein